MFKRLIKFLNQKKLNQNVRKVKSLGSNVQISYPFFASKYQNLIIGSDIYIGPGAWISSYGEVEILSGAIIGPRLKIYTGNHNYDSSECIPYDAKTLTEKVIIGENVWIGGDVILLPGVEIGEGSIVGAGSVVTKSFPPCSIIGGNPAKIIKERNKEIYYKLKAEEKIYLRLKSKGLMKPYTQYL